ncbi:FAD-dependent oxidoreductase [Aquisalimonas sp. 2447]|uniref:NAD(P)/FAD-dependent oxidoreductase n=1 Tax=Aquisalimonas sp. 2447 TaxID=2740807 RepID=UPI0014324628|nr:FAD-dependent oxidoreductase [Aquisalimonas sp. 2447]QIT56659.1 FAD-dependent oxidoreductase [Aquisalimonas sp. 2447]
MNGSRIAVVGGGISGLGAAWLLSRRHSVTLFEGNDYVGGHSRTRDVPGRDGPVPVDTGFIVYNERNYPHLSSLFRQLDVPTRDSDMSFAFRSADGGLEWAGDSVNKLFAQRRNLLSPSFLRMVGDILRFNRRARRFLADDSTGEPSLGEFLDAMNASSELRQQYLLPMAAAIWSCPPQDMLAFPARRFLQFFHNHGLLDVANRPQWRTVAGGAREYVRRMLPGITGGYHTRTPVRRISRVKEGVELFGDDGLLGRFDQVVVGAHADQTLAMLEQPSYWEERLLSAFRYQENIGWLHSDPQLMPRLRRVWASWNYQAGAQQQPASVTYWMNRLQGLDGVGDVFVSLNPESPPDESLVYERAVYDHPVFDGAAVRAQGMMEQIQGRDRIWFCGSYLGYGFHEDGLRSAVNVAGRLGVRPAWLDPEPVTQGGLFGSPIVATG